MSIAYSQLDYALHAAITSLAGLTEETGLAVTTHIAFPVKMGILRSLIDLKLEDGEVRTELLALVDRAADGNARRNGIIHDSWAVRNDGAEFRVATKARGKLSMTSTEATAAAVLADATFIRSTSLDLIDFLRDSGLARRAAQTP